MPAFRYTRLNVALNWSLSGDRLRLVLMLLIVCLWPTACLVAAQQTEQGEFLPSNQKWRGDFDGMVDRREIRALVDYSKTFYFLDQGDV